MNKARLWWVRHGPTHVNRVVGWEDVPANLSDADTLKALHDLLPDEAPVVSSDLLRTRQTLEAIRADRPHLDPLKDLREMHFGAWEGLTAAQIEERDPDVSRRFWTGEANLRVPGGESWSDLSARVDRAEETLLSLNRDIVVVAHMGVIMTRIHKAKGGSVNEAMSHVIAPLSVTRIDHSSGAPKLIFAGQRPDAVNTS